MSKRFATPANLWAYPHGGIILPNHDILRKRWPHAKGMSHWWCCCSQDPAWGESCWTFYDTDSPSTPSNPSVVDASFTTVDGTCTCSFSGDYEDIDTYQASQGGIDNFGVNYCFYDYRQTYAGVSVVVVFLASQEAEKIALSASVSGYSFPCYACFGHTPITTFKYPLGFNVLDVSTWQAASAPWPDNGSHSPGANNTCGCSTSGASCTVTWST